MGPVAPIADWISARVSKEHAAGKGCALLVTNALDTKAIVDAAAATPKALRLMLILPFAVPARDRCGARVRILCDSGYGAGGGGGYDLRPASVERPIAMRSGRRRRRGRVHTKTSQGGRQRCNVARARGGEDLSACEQRRAQSAVEDLVAKIGFGCVHVVEEEASRCRRCQRRIEPGARHLAHAAIRPGAREGRLQVRERPDRPVP